MKEAPCYKDITKMLWEDHIGLEQYDQSVRFNKLKSGTCRNMYINSSYLKHTDYEKSVPLSEEGFHRQTKKRSQILSKQDNPCKKMSKVFLCNTFNTYSFDVNCSKGHRQKPPLGKCSFSPQTVGEGVTNLPSTRHMEDSTSLG